MLRNKYQMKRRQKPAGRPVLRIENETNPEDAAQYFQVTLKVLEARKLAWTNPHSANSYVIVVLGKKKQRTNIRRNMEEPHYQEYFVFEMYMSIRNMKRTNMWLAVMEPRCCAPARLLGETNVNMGTIWTQPHHQIFHKWAQLSLSRDPAAGLVGFLKVDISIIFKGCTDIMHPISNDDKVEENLLLPSGSEQQRANYMITIYAGFGLSNLSKSASDRNYGKPPSTFVRVTFCGLTVKTAVQQHNVNPIFCEQMSIVEMFPNMSQLVYLELCSGDSYLNKVIGGVHLSLTQISHDSDNGFIPTFGPSLLHMYGTASPGTHGIDGDDGAFHRGALLVSLKTIVPYYKQSIRTTNIEPVIPIKLENLWTLEDFCIFCPILEVSMLDRLVVGKYCGVAITIAEMPSGHVPDEEFFSMMSEIRSRKLHYTGSMDVIKTRPVYGYLHFANSFPVLQLATRLPDYRFRMYRNNMVYGIVADLEHTLKDVEKRLKNLDYSTPNELIEELNKAIGDTFQNILKFLDVIQYSSTSTTNCDDVMKKYNTELDEKQMVLQKEEIEKIYQDISKKCKYNVITDSIATTKSNNATRKEVKLLLAETKALAQNLRPFVLKTSEGWPDIVVWLLNSGSRVAYARVSPADVIYSVVPEQCGRHCGRIQTVNMKPLKCLKQMHSPDTGCFCIAGKIELSLWMGLYKELSGFETFLPNGYKIKIKDCVMSLKAATTMMLECRAFIYRAKLMNTVDNFNLGYTFVRVNALNTVKESRVRQKTLTPIWNQVLKINKMVYTSQERLIHSPPDVCIEVYDSDLSGKSELIGRIQMQPVIDDRQDYEFAPKLQWHELYIGMEYTGQLLMSVQILQIPETLLRTTNYGPVEETYYVADVQEQDIDNMESLPEILIPQFTTYKLDVYWWGLRDVNITRKPGVVLEIEELIVKSDIIIDKKPNCNFPKGRTTQIFDAPLEEAYSPPLTIKLYDQSTFGRTLFLGTNVVKNPNKYIVYWYSRNERELALRNATFTSMNYYEVLPLQYIINKKHYNEKKKENSSQMSKKNFVESKVKRSRWKKFFWRRERDDEEHLLLPIFTKENYQIKKDLNFTRKDEDNDWWMRFFSSHKDTDDRNFTDDRITIYNTELETQPEFSKFKDWCTTFKLYNGKKSGIPEKDERLHCGYLKAGIAIYKWPPPQNTIAVSPRGVDLSQGYFNNHPTNDPAKFLVRVYIVKGVDLIAKDFTGKLDPYCVIKCGNKYMGDRNCYITNTVNPVFGKMYEFRCMLPEDYLLTVSLYDYDAMSADELIGSTTIDLEDRIYSKHRGRVGLPLLYTSSGSAKWRDCIKPSAILEELCSLNHTPPPIYTNINSVILNGVEYKDNERCTKSFTSPSDIKECVCLSLLHKWHTLPICGYHLVPEHVETRSLYNPEKRRIEQGKIQMWVDIFPLDTGLYIPMPVDITPRKMEDYELRLIIWDVRVLLPRDYDLRGNKYANIYVKAWIGSEQDAQYTDVHSRSKSGEGSFNWRMIFHFQYKHTTGEIVKKEKDAFVEFEELVSPIVVIQVLESDSLPQDDFIASLALNLNAMSEGTDSVHQYTTEYGKSKRINLFLLKSVRAWWPLFAPVQQTGLNVNAGMIDLEMTLLPSKRAICFPAGLGRDPPQPLPQPRRPELNESKHFPLLESLLCNGSLAYAVIGFILIISLIVFCLYLEIPRTALDYIFD